jgi:hypothetical protein
LDLEVARADGPAIRRDAARTQCDLLRLVRDALEIGGALDDREQQPEVAGGRLAPRDDLARERVDRALELVDRDLVAHHLVDQRACARGEALDAVDHLALNARAHLAHQALGTLEQLVELARGVRLRHARRLAAQHDRIVSAIPDTVRAAWKWRARTRARPA